MCTRRGAKVMRINYVCREGDKNKLCVLLWATLHGLAKDSFLLRLAAIKRVASGEMLD